jgi:hypothetical protein
MFKRYFFIRAGVCWIISCLILGCHSGNNSFDLPIRTVDLDRMTTKDYVLSDIIHNIEYRYLNKPMGGPITKYDISDSYAVFYDGMDRILLFHRDGQFIKQISRSGKGPGEYDDIDDLVLDESDNALYALCRTDRIFKYDLQGNFLKKITIHRDIDLLALAAPGVVLLHIANWTGHQNERFIVMDGNGEILEKYPNRFTYQLNERHIWKKETVKYTYNHQLHVKDKGDTLYCVLKDKMIPRYVFKNSRSIHIDGLTQEIYDQSLEFDYIFETDDRLYFSFRQYAGKNKVNYKLGYYDKRTDQTFSYQKTDPSKHEDVKNDMDDGAAYYLRKQYNNILMGFRLDFDDELLQKAPIQTRETIESLRNGIDDEDPFFMFIMHLK